MDIVELDLNDSQTISRFEEFYNNVFSKSFARDEIGSIKAYLDLKSNEKLYDHEYEYHLSFIENDGKYVACFIFCWFPKIRMMAAEFACVDEKFRGKGLAKKLMKHAEAKYDFKWMFGEIESFNSTNLSIWNRYGFKAVPIKYQQLPLGDDRGFVDNMKLCAYSKDKKSTISLADVKTFVWHYYKYSQFCDNPDETQTIKSLCSIKQQLLDLENIA